MRHLLKWRPLEADCETLYYSVMFQGEFEIHMLNGSWVDAYNCQKIIKTECDLTLDLGSDSDYSISVQALCDGQTSWGRLPMTFNRKDTLLEVPNMTVDVTGSMIQVSTQVIKARPYLLFFDTKQNRGRHCLKAEAFLETINKTSISKTRCVYIFRPLSHWLMPLIVSATIAVIIAMALALGWMAPHCGAWLRQGMCHKEVLPKALIEEWPGTTPTLFSEILLESTHSDLVLHPLEVQDRKSEMKATCTANIPAEAILSS
ncbi:cytokine receptor family member B16 [Electrophorus electricus]|uniref:cytokine receptor family member B16 n=1 Tax=Electrophorus electricus TaxID=8005 RepID=UPI0015D048A5|nr:cytokine receptor family member B16 [Electrophorus electricus]